MTPLDAPTAMGLDQQAGHPAVFYDGASNRKRRVRLRLDTELDISEDGHTLAVWPYDAIRRVDGDGLLRLSAISAPPLARLEIADEAVARAVMARCQSLDREGAGGTRRIVAWSLAAACSIILLVLYGIPLVADRLTPLLPASVEARLGQAVDNQVRTVFGNELCSRPDGQAAFAKMVDTLARAGGITAPLQARVLSSGIPNAVALPGGTIYLFKGLLDRARNPDEIAGVIAHEIGHVHHRDGLRTLIRIGGSSFLFGLLLGDITGGGAVIFATRALLDASHSRETETAADDFAIATMIRLGRSPAEMGELLVRISGSGKGSILDSHPVSSERLERMKKLERPSDAPPILTGEEWRALKAICDGP